jgi:hypothetical protein
MTELGVARLTQRWSRPGAAGLLVPAGALALLGVTVTLFLILGGGILGYDFEAYAGAARRIVAGERLYDPGVSVAGGFGVYLYPPPFALAVVPLLALPDELARVVWAVAMAGCFALGAAMLPVRRDLRWSVVALGALNWPLLYSIRLGQVGPLLFLLFAAAWRWRDRAGPAAGAIAAGTLVKVQPAILILWAAVTGRRRAAWLAGAGVVAVAAAATALTGLGVWPDYVALLGRVSSAAATPHNCSPGAVLYQAGAPEGAAAAAQWLSTTVAAAAVLLAWRYARAVASLQVTILASQLLTPLLWDHYAMLLLLPVAWLMERGRGWAAAIPLAGWIAMLPWTAAFESGGAWLPAASVPLAFFVCLAALLWEARLERREGGLDGREGGLDGREGDLTLEGAP